MTSQVEDCAPSSRIYVRGLPPNLTFEEFKKHFSKQQAITDAKLIAHRRIGYVGYKTPEDALKAVKYHHRSFIRLSKLAVEIARPYVAENRSEALRRDGVEALVPVEKPSSQSNGSSEPGASVLKRKHDALGQTAPDHRLQELLDVMKPVPKFKTWANGDCPTSVNLGSNPDNSVEAQSTLDTTHSNDEPPQKRVKIPNHTLGTTPAMTTAPRLVAMDSLDTVLDSAQSQSANSTAKEQEIFSRSDPQSETYSSDADWLRSRTSRLLGLVEDDSSGVDASGEGISIEEKPTELANIDPPGPPNEGLRVDQNIDDNHFAPGDTSMKSEYKAICITGRLFVRNLPYGTSKDDLQEYFSSQNARPEVHLASTSGSSEGKGFAFVQFTEPALAVQAYHDLDGKIFQGRLLHILPAAAKRENKLDDLTISKLPLKKQKQIRRRREAASTTFNWNSMFMSIDAVNTSISDRLGVPKSELLNPTSSDAAVRQAHAETHIIQESKVYFAANGVDLKAFQRNVRGDDTLLIKNFPYSTKVDDIRTLFGEFGQIATLLMPPAGTIAIVRFCHAHQAQAAFSNLAYRRFKDSVLFLEMAPKDLLKTGVRTVEPHPPEPSTHDSAHTDEQGNLDTTTLFVRNLNFSTTTERLTSSFSSLDGFVTARIKTKSDSKRSGHTLSMGFGFLEFRSNAHAQAALSAIDGYILDGHRLSVKASHKGVDAAAKQSRHEQKAKDISRRSTKVVIKNLPFEASRKDVRALFGSYGQLRSVRVPKKFDHSTRGFAFADFLTAREAENAMDALKDTHLLGRRLVLDFATEEPADPEEEIARMQKRVGRQVNKLALQRLTGSGRKKFDVESSTELGE